MPELKMEIDHYLNRLFPICRSITGNGNRTSLGILRELIPLEIKEVPSGTTVYDWIVPPEWNIRDAWIADASGNRLVDFKSCNVHVVSYSEPVKKCMSWEELSGHLHQHDSIPDAIPYRTTYFKRDWGFCVTKKQYEQIRMHKGDFHVEIDSTLDNNGSLSYAELLIPGRLPEEILISTYICHPSLANDNLSGFLLTAFLARNLLQRKRNLYSYRIIFVPETIGAITYCAINEQAMKAINMGFVVTTVGGKGPIGYKKSFDGCHFLNQLVEGILSVEKKYKVYPFNIHGSDERQYSSLGFRINMVSITKDKYYDYDYYHSSLDNLDFVSAENISRTFQVYLRVFDQLDSLEIYVNMNPNCEVMLSKHGLYPDQGGGQVPDEEGIDELDLRLWLLWHCDGKKPLFAIANELNVHLDKARQSVKELETRGILRKL